MKYILLILFFLLTDILKTETPGFYTINRGSNNIEFLDFEGNRRIITRINIPITSPFGNIRLYKNDLLLTYKRILYRVCLKTGNTEIISDFSDLFQSGLFNMAIFNNDIYMQHELSADSRGALYKYDFENDKLLKITSGLSSDINILAIEFDNKGNLYGYSEASDKLFQYNLKTGDLNNYIGNRISIKFASDMSYFDSTMWVTDTKADKNLNGMNFHTVNLKTGETKFQFSKPDNYFGMAFLENECTPLVFKCEFGDYVFSIDRHDNYVLTGDAIYQDVSS